MTTPETLEAVAAQFLGWAQRDIMLASVAQWKADRLRLAEAERAIRLVANDMGDRKHASSASECREWRRALLAALAHDKGKDGWLLPDGHRAGHA